MLRTFIFGKTAAPNPKPGPQLGMLALKSAEGLTPERVCKAWVKLFPTLPPISSISDADAAGGDEVLSFRVGSRQVMVAQMPIPIPRGDVEGAVEVSWMWPEAREKMAAQKCHALVTCVMDGDSVGEAVDVSRVICAAAGAGEPAGVYWGCGGQVHKPRMFYDFVKGHIEEGPLPVLMWIGVRQSAKSELGPFTVTTLGMHAFGHKELEIIDSRMGIGDLRMLVFDTIGYLLENGPILKHNQTFGRTADERHRVEHTMSKFRRGVAVVRLHVP